MIKTLTPQNLHSEAQIVHKPSAALINSLLNYSKSLAVQEIKKEKVLLNLN